MRPASDWSILLILSSDWFSPELPPKLQRVMAATHTWMGDAVKAAVSYPR